MSVQYLAIVRETTFDPALVTRDMWEGAMAAHKAFAEAVAAAGGQILVTAGLQADDAFTVTPPRNGNPALFTDGPFAEAREVNHGFCLFEIPDGVPVKDLAAIIPSGGSVEVYPVAHAAAYPAG
ncbi:MAG: YciI family protein [Specibacter sp.]